MHPDLKICYFFELNLIIYQDLEYHYFIDLTG